MLKQTIRPGAALNLLTNRFVKPKIDSLEFVAKRSRAAVGFRFHGLAGGGRQRSVQLVGIEAVKRIDALSQAVRFVERAILFQFVDQALQRTHHPSRAYLSRAAAASGSSLSG